jgi:hypothetical protein
MTDGRYTVSQSREVGDQLRRLGRTAHAEGRFQSFADGARWIFEELSRTPTEFGESRYESGSLAFRCGFAGALYVEYAVKSESRAVFIRRFSLVRG